MKLPHILLLNFLLPFQVYAMDVSGEKEVLGRGSKKSEMHRMQGEPKDYIEGNYKDAQQTLLSSSYLQEEYESGNGCLEPFLVAIRWFNLHYFQNSEEVDAGKTYSRTVSRECMLDRLPIEVIWCIACKLDLLQVILFSRTNKTLNMFIDSKFWRTYENLFPKKYFLNWNGKYDEIFFIHLLYRQGKIQMAANLGHPEANVFIRYGIEIPSDQFILSKTIRYANGDVNIKLTSKLAEEEVKFQKKEMLDNQLIEWLIESAEASVKTGYDYEESYFFS